MMTVLVGSVDMSELYSAASKYRHASRYKCPYPVPLAVTRIIRSNYRNL